MVLVVIVSVSLPRGQRDLSSTKLRRVPISRIPLIYNLRLAPSAAVNLLLPIELVGAIRLSQPALKDREETESESACTIGVENRDGRSGTDIVKSVVRRAAWRTQEEKKRRRRTGEEEEGEASRSRCRLVPTARAASIRDDRRPWQP